MVSYLFSPFQNIRFCGSSHFWLLLVTQLLFLFRICLFVLIVCCFSAFWRRALFCDWFAVPLWGCFLGAESSSAPQKRPCDVGAPTKLALSGWSFWNALHVALRSVHSKKLPYNPHQKLSNDFYVSKSGYKITIVYYYS